ncbi:MAG: hypothetical protein COC09_05195 [Gammaproteobacteria bacterium]|nr:MAG: hypothetical protein COC09_07000 [Gammaproteobacteria bacterium]PCH63639.1 MAG: hypothetical protein COC09_05195 [Gammaproteobacteria bacterium]
MKRYSTYVSAIGALCLLAALLWVLPEEVSLYLNIPGLLLVLGGSIGATCVSRRRKHVLGVIRRLPMLFKRRHFDTAAQVDRFLAAAETYRHGRIRLTENLALRIGDPFAASAVGLIVDRIKPEEINKILQWRVNAVMSTEQAKIQVVKTMASFAPALGMLGTLLALVHMLYGLDSADINEIGRSMAFAMTTTLYGIVIANLICRPLAMKMEQVQQQKLTILHMWIEGINGMIARRHPIIIKESMDAFIMQNEQFETDMPGHVVPAH